MYHFKFLLALSISIVIFSSCKCQNKYSKEANEPTNLTDRQFRMAKINLIWEKAQKRLTSIKMQSLFKDLKEQDKIEMALKKLKTENQDKDGLKEAEIRSKLDVLLTKYGLTDLLDQDPKQSNDVDQEVANQKRLFKDKNLDKLWTKALQSKFSDEELKILKEEFQHYEDKLVEYHNLIDKVHDLEDKTNSEKDKWENSLERLDDDHEFDSRKSTNDYHQQHLNEKHREVKSSYFKLQNKILNKDQLVKPRTFEEDDAEKLWQTAKEAKFDETELEAIKRELFHFEHRIKKLNYLNHHHGEDEYDSKFKNTYESDDNKFIQNKIKELTTQIDKLKSDIEARILQRHIEL